MTTELNRTESKLGSAALLNEEFVDDEVGIVYVRGR